MRESVSLPGGGNGGGYDPFPSVRQQRVLVVNETLETGLEEHRIIITIDRGQLIITAKVIRSSRPSGFLTESF